MINVAQVKEKIISMLKENGPTLPVRISKKLSLEPMLISAILSELLNEKRIKTSSMRVGSSPLYLIPGMEAALENFIDNLTGVEKEALLMLKEKQVIEDEKLESRMKVAIRGIKDFAIPITIQGKQFWKYFILSNDQALNLFLNPAGNSERIIGQKIAESIEPSKSANFPEKKSPVEIKEVVKMEFPREIVKSDGKKPSKKDSAFLNMIKLSLIERKIELLEVLSQSNKEVVLRVKIGNNDLILVSFNQKKIEEKEVLKAYKKALPYNLPYIIFCQTDPSRKLQEKLTAYRALFGFEVDSGLA